MGVCGVYADTTNTAAGATDTNNQVRISDIVIPDTIVVSDTIKIQNFGAVDFAHWAASKCAVESGDVVVAKCQAIVSTNNPLIKNNAIAPIRKRLSRVRVKTPGSEGSFVDYKLNGGPGPAAAFIATENGPVIYASTAGTSELLIIEVHRNVPTNELPVAVSNAAPSVVSAPMSPVWFDRIIVPDVSTQSVGCAKAPDATHASINATIHAFMVSPGETVGSLFHQDALAYVLEIVALDAAQFRAHIAVVV